MEDDFWKTVIRRRFGAAIDMLDNAMSACPDDLWCDRYQPPEWNDRDVVGFWYVAYHTLFFLDYYLSDSLERFAPPPPFTLDELDPAGIRPNGRIRSRSSKPISSTAAPSCRQRSNRSPGSKPSRGAALDRSRAASWNRCCIDAPRAASCGPTEPSSAPGSRHGPTVCPTGAGPAIGLAAVIPLRAGKPEQKRPRTAGARAAVYPGAIPASGPRNVRGWPRRGRGRTLRNAADCPPWRRGIASSRPWPGGRAASPGPACGPGPPAGGAPPKPRSAAVRATPNDAAAGRPRGRSRPAWDAPARCAPARATALQNVVHRAAQVEIHLAPGLIFEDDEQRGFPPVEPLFHRRQHLGGRTRGNQTVAGKGGKSTILFHIVILPG